MAVEIPYQLPMRQDDVVAPSLEQDFAELRSTASVVRATFPFGGDGWIAIGYDAVRQVLSDRRFSVEEGTRGDYPRIRFTEGGPPFPPAFVRLDPPEHTKKRGVIMKHLTVKRVRALHPAMERIAEELLDEIEKRGSPTELVSSYTNELPVRVLCHLLGMPPEEQDRFLPDAYAVAHSTVTDPKQAERHFRSLLDYFVELVERKRAQPGEDLLSALIHDTEVEGAWTLEELNGVGVLLLIAGHDATSGVLGGIVYWLIHQPQSYQRLRDNPDEIPRAYEEFVRFLPAGLAGTRSRIAMEDIVVDGTLIKAGQAVLPIVHAANFDKSVFEDADIVDLDKGPRQHVAFGYGAHACLGAQLARAESAVAVKALLARFPKLSPVEHDPDWRQGLLLRGPKSINASW